MKANKFVFLLRHGEIEKDSQKRFIGTTDLPLNRVGEAQADYWKKQFGADLPDIIYTSQLTRCRQMARMIARDSKITHDARLNEIHLGEWENQTFEQVKKQFPNEFKKRGANISQYRIPGAETFRDVSNRAVPFFIDCVADCARNEKSGLFITHAGVIRVLLCHLTGLELNRLLEFKITYGELTVLKMTGS